MHGSLYVCASVYRCICMEVYMYVRVFIGVYAWKFLFFKVASGQLIIACLINLDMINISVESFKLVLNEIKHIENKNSFIIIIIRTDAFIKGGSNEEMASRYLQLHTDLENTSFLILI